MDRIKLLPEIVANQIAAGEVVNAPSNVVKEMMENSIDAGARNVRVNFRDGGKELIQIIDDGIGMSAIDARMAFDRHATSKIRTIEDVYALHTFGFRGEALASIAAVSEVELRTRQQDDELGTLTTVSGGEYRSQIPVSCSVGSQFLVRNLFYNVPSRRKFIDGDNARLALHIKQEFQRVALCNHDVAFELRQNDGIVYSLSATNRVGRIIDVVGKHIRQNLLEVDVDTSVVRIEGYIGRPAAAKRRNSEQFLFVNGRYFQSPAIQRTIIRAYEKLIPEGSVPSYFIYLTVDADKVDVNVHPQKTTVKFADNEVLIQILQAAVRETLAKTGAVPLMDFSSGQVDIPVIGREQVVYKEPRAMSNSAYNPFDEKYIDPTAPMPDVPFTGFDVPYDGVAQPTTPSISDVGAFNIPSTSSTPLATPSFVDSGSVVEYIDEQESQASFEYIDSSMSEDSAMTSFGEAMSLGNGYAVAMYGGRSVVVSLRRVRERILYEELLRGMNAGAAPTQRMFFAETLTLSNEEYALMEQHAAEFSALGFEIEYRDGGEIAIEGRPALIDMTIPLDQLIYDMLHNISDGISALQCSRERLADIMARRGSAGYGRNVSSAEVVELLQRLQRCENYNFTPSGNPIMAELTLEEIRSKLSKS